MLVTNQSAPPSVTVLACYSTGGQSWYMYTYGNRRPHLGRGLEAQAPHGLLGAEGGHGALPEHVEGTGGLHCGRSGVARRKRGVGDQWYSMRLSCSVAVAGRQRMEAWPGTCAAASGEAASSFVDHLSSARSHTQASKQTTSAAHPTLTTATAQTNTPREIPQTCLTMRSA